MMWLIFAFAASVAPIGLIVFQPLHPRAGRRTAGLVVKVAERFSQNPLSLTTEPRKFFT